MSATTRIASALGASHLAALLVSIASCGSRPQAAGGPDAGKDASGAEGSVLSDAGNDGTVEAESPPDDGGTTDAAATADGAESGPDGGRDFSTDRAKFFGTSRCATAGVQLCEDFETGTLNKAIWAVSGTPPVIDGNQHARGTHALHIKQNGNGLSYIKETMTFPEPKNTYFGRVFVYFESIPTETLPAPPGITYAHWTILAGSGTGVPGEIRVSGQLQNKVNLFGVGTDNRTDGGTGDWTNSDKDPNDSPNPVPTKQWICIEWMHKGDTNETQFWWDAMLHPSLSTSSTMHGGNDVPFLLPQFTNVWLGWQEYQTTTEPFELWMDEIAIDTRRIGCVL